MAQRAPAERLRIVVMGYAVRWPVGGMLWHYLNYVLGFSAMGHEVRFFEESGSYDSCWDPSRREMGIDPTFGLKFVGDAFELVGLSGNWCYYDQHTATWMGPESDRMLAFLASADLLINVSGVTEISDRTGSIPYRMLIDTDPGFTQIKNLTDPAERERASRHNVFLTFGGNISEPGTSIPDDGFPWQPTRQPVSLTEWPTVTSAPTNSLTTVMQWKSYDAVEFDGRRLGMKSESFEPFLNIPQLTGARVEIAASRFPTEDRLRLEGAGWLVVSGDSVSQSPESYRRYIQGSVAEFTVAKQGYVTTGSGWFSERIACYLASGRPVITQDTGFSKWLPTGIGLLSFDSMDDAGEAIERVLSRYEKNAAAAREVAVEYFAAEKVLEALLDAAVHVASTTDSPTDRK